MRVCPQNLLSEANPALANGFLKCQAPAGKTRKMSLHYRNIYFCSFRYSSMDAKDKISSQRLVANCWKHQAWPLLLLRHFSIVNKKPECND